MDGPQNSYNWMDPYHPDNPDYDLYIAELGVEDPNELSIKIAEARQKLAVKAQENQARYLLKSLAQAQYDTIISKINYTHHHEVSTITQSIPNKNIVIIDPISAVIGKSFGISDDNIHKEIAATQGISININPDSDATFSTPKFRTMPLVYGPEGIKELSYVKPSVGYYMEEGSENETLLVSTGQEYSTFNFLTSQSTRVNHKLIMHHELAHAADSKFLVNTNHHNIYDPNADKLVHDKDYRCEVVALQNGEGYADINALGTLIRKGQPTELIDSLIETRQKCSDFGHNTTPILEGFKSKLQEIGNISFKALSPSEAEDLYVETVSKYGTSDRVVYLAGLKYLTDIKEPGDLPKYEDQDLDPIEIQNFNILTNFLVSSNIAQHDVEHKRVRQLNSLAHLTSEDITELENYNVVGELKQKAFELDNKITPVSLAIAFANKMKELEESKGQEPEKVELINHKMAITQSCFEHTVKNMDYIQENRDRHIELFEFSNGDITLKTSPTPQAPSISPNKPKTLL